jgi:hypothetical protein
MRLNKMLKGLIFSCLVANVLIQPVFAQEYTSTVTFDPDTAYTYNINWQHNLTSFPLGSVIESAEIELRVQVWYWGYNIYEQNIDIMASDTTTFSLPADRVCELNPSTNPNSSLFYAVSCPLSSDDFELINNDGSIYFGTNTYGGTYYLEYATLTVNVASDEDGDGLSDTLENTMCAFYDDADSDDDGIIDGLEDANHSGTVDAGETDPCDADTDGDGIQDGTESGVSTGHADTAGSFIPDADSGATVTDPLNADSDGDGLSDGEEDANHNGQINTGETDPSDSDTENDGMPDGWEVTNDLNPLIDDANGDADEDGYINLIEYQRKTDPQDINSHPSKGMPWLPILLEDE